LTLLRERDKMKNHIKVIFNFKDMIFQTVYINLMGSNYKDLKYWLGNKFRFAESKKGWGNYSRKELNRITKDIKRYEKMNPQTIKEEELEFKVIFKTKKKDIGGEGYITMSNVITQIVKAKNPVTAVEKALIKSKLFAEDVIRTEILKSENNDVTDVNLVEIDSRNYQGKEEVKMSKVITIKDLSNKFGIDPKRIRVITRKLGLKPNPTGVEGFGPKKKYEWEKNSKGLEKIVAALKEEVAEEKAKK